MSKTVAKEVVPDSTRWPLLINFSLGSFLNACIWLTFSSTELVSTTFDVSSQTADWLSLIFIINTAPGILLSLFTVRKYGLTFTIRMTSMIQAIGAIIVALAVPHAPADQGHLRFAFVLFGQFLAGLGQPVFNTLSSHLTARWCPSSERENMNVMVSMSNALGIATGQLISSAIFSGAQADEAPKLFFYNALGHCALAVVLALWALTLTKEHPGMLSATVETAAHPANWPVAESAGGAGMVAPLLAEAPAAINSSGDPATVSSRSVWTGIRTDIAALVRNIPFLTVLLPYALGLAIFNLLVMQLPALLAPCAVPALDPQQLIAVMIFAGLGGCLAWGFVISRVHRMAIPLKACYVAAALALLLLLFTLHPAGTIDGGFLGLLQRAPLTLVFAAAGACMLPLMTLSFETAMAVTRDVSIHSMQCVLLVIAQVPSILVSPVVSSFLHDEAYAYSCHHVYQHQFGLTMFALVGVSIIVIMTLPHNSAVKLTDKQGSEQTGELTEQLVV